MVQKFHHVVPYDITSSQCRDTGEEVHYATHRYTKHTSASVGLCWSDYGLLSSLLTFVQHDECRGWPVVSCVCGGCDWVGKCSTTEASIVLVLEPGAAAARPARSLSQRSFVLNYRTFSARLPPRATAAAAPAPP